MRSWPSSPRAPLLQRLYPPSSLLLAHAPLPTPLALIFLVGIQSALAACVIHGWSSGASRLYSADLSRSATSPTPAPCRIHRANSSPTASAFAVSQPARRLAIPSRNEFYGMTRFRGCRHSVMLWPFGLLARLLVRDLAVRCRRSRPRTYQLELSEDVVTSFSSRVWLRG